MRIRAGFQQENVDHIVKILVESGFYFASEVNVFDQVKCFFCATSFSCDIFGFENFTKEILNSNHAQQCRTCTFLIGELGAVEFDHLLRQRIQVQLPIWKKRRKKEKNLSQNPETIYLDEATDFAETEADDKFQNLRDLMKCKVCSANRSNVLFSPCHHISSCAECASTIYACPACNRPIIDFVPILFG